MQAEASLQGGGTFLSPISIPQQGQLKSQKLTPRDSGSQKGLCKFYQLDVLSMIYG